MKKTIISLFLIILTICLLGCSSKSNDTIADNIKILKPGMSISEVSSLFGVKGTDDVFSGVYYPFGYSWKMNDGNRLVIIFAIDGCDDQAALNAALDRGDFAREDIGKLAKLVGAYISAAEFGRGDVLKTII